MLWKKFLWGFLKTNLVNLPSAATAIGFSSQNNNSP